MFLRRLGPNRRECQGGYSCPDILELHGGDFAVIGSDITNEAMDALPSGSGCGPGEKIVRVPRQILVLARPDIPTSV
jgi:hypothetical protein